MKNVVKGLVIGSLVASSVAYGCNEGFCNEGTYISLSGGIGKTVKVKSNQDFPLLLKSPGIFTTPVSLNSYTFKNSRNLNAAIGYRFGNFRVEVNPLLFKAKYKTFHQEPYELVIRDNLSGSNRILAGLINGYVNMNLTESFMPYLGIGFGYAQVKNELKHIGLYEYIGSVYTEIPAVKVSMKDNSFVFQGILGTILKINNNVGLTLDYRYLSTTKKINAFNDTIKNHSINLGVMYAF